jgi:hypothetical protein
VARASGWRWFQGTTEGGKQLDDVVCPFCAGVKDPLDQPWDVMCYTCDWGFMGEFEPGDEIIASAHEAVALGREHRCEPDVWIYDPDQNARSLNDFNSNGSLRKGVK